MDDQIEKSLEEISHLDEIILKLYNAVYAKGGKYATKFFDVSSLKMLRFKLSDYNLDTIFDKTKIQLIGEFPTGMIDDDNKIINEIRFKRRGETHGSTIRIVPYAEAENLDDMDNPINVNQIIRTLLSELVGNDRTNNILLPLVNVDVSGKDMEFYNKIAPLIDTDKYYSIEITEKYYSMITLDIFLKEYPLDLRVLKTIIYQAIDLLYQINLTYPGFRHNQLFPQMIDCYLKQIDNIVLPELKLGNFYLSEIKEIIKNNYLEKSKLSIPDIDSPYNDLYQLLNYMWNNLYADIKKYPELITLFDILLPKQIRSEGPYLTKELWDKLTDEEKFDLRIKNLRNNTSFTTKDSLVNTQFLENNKDDENTLGGKLDNFEVPVDLTTDVDISEDSPLNITKNNTTITNINRMVDKDDKEITGSNKKYYDNDIDNMSNKNSGKSNDSRKNNDSQKRNDAQKRNEAQKRNDARKRNDPEISDWNDDNRSKSNHYESNNSQDTNTEITEEQTEERGKNNRQGRIINISDTDYSKRQNKNRTKTYRGKRLIGSNPSSQNGPTNGSTNGSSNTSSFKKELYDAISQPMQNNTQYDNVNPTLVGNQNRIYPDGVNYNVQNNGVPSRINSIGSMLGVSSNDYMNRNNNANLNYGQIGQQMAQQFQNDPNQMAHQMSSYLPQNIPSQIPMPIQNPTGPMMQQQLQQAMQQPMQQSDTDMIYRYLAASNQMPSQQSQLDPSVMAALMQQQIPQQTQIPYQMGANQMGGNGNTNRNPFFFQ